MDDMKVDEEKAKKQKDDTADMNVEEDGDEEEEIPDCIKKLPESEQQKAIIKMSLRIMATGTLLVILFSDPMVGILSAFGTVIGVSPF